MALSDRHYRELGSEERVRLVVAAQARSDEVEVERLLTSAPRCQGCGGVGHDVTVPLNLIASVGAAANIALAGPLEAIEALALLLRPASPWPDFLDDAEYPRPTMVGREILNGVTAAATHDPKCGADFVGGESHISGRDLGDLTTAAVRRVEELVARSIVLAHQRVVTAVDGIELWCDAVALDAEAFLADWCGGPLDRLAALRPIVERCGQMLMESTEKFGSAESGRSPNIDPDQGDQVGSLDLMVVLLDAAPTLAPEMRT